MPVLNTTLSTLLRAELAWTYENALPNSTTKDQDSIRHEMALADGTAAGQADLIWHDRRQVTPAAPIDDIDLSGVLQDSFGQTMSLVRVKALLIVNRDSTAGEDLLLGGAGAAGNAWAAFADGDVDAQLRIGAGSAMLLTAPLDGYLVVPGTADVLRIEHAGPGGGDGVEFDIALVGTSA